MRINHVVSTRYDAATKAQSLWRGCAVRFWLRPQLETRMNLWRYSAEPEDLRNVLHHALSVLCTDLQFHRATKIFSEYLDLDPNNALALFGLGIASVLATPGEDEGAKREALESLERARKLSFPRDALSLYAELFFDPTCHQIWLDAEASWQRKGLHLCVCALFCEWALGEVGAWVVRRGEKLGAKEWRDTRESSHVPVGCVSPYIFWTAESMRV